MIMRVFLIFMIIFSSPIIGHAHSWYPYECCSDKDCYPVKTDKVKVVKGGWEIDGFFYRHDEVRESPDEFYHICRLNDGGGPVIVPDKQKPCVWVPVEGS